MSEVKTQRSRNYQEYLIESLKNPERAAGYMSVMLELDEEGYDPKMLRSALSEVVEARKQLGDFSEFGQQHFEKLDKMLAENGGNEILALIEFFDALGYRIGIVPKE